MENLNAYINKNNLESANLYARGLGESSELKFFTFIKNSDERHNKRRFLRNLQVQY